MNEAEPEPNNTWLAAAKPTALLPRELLEERILNLLASQNMAVVATVAPDGSPAATPVRYYSLGMELMYTSWNASPKSRNLARDARVSAAVFAPLAGPASSRGLQVFGTARTLERDDPSVEKYWAAFGWQSDHVAAGRSLSEPPTDPLTVITPLRILYTEHWLRRSGFSPRQTWRPVS